MLDNARLTPKTTLSIPLEHTDLASKSLCATVTSNMEVVLSSPGRMSQLCTEAVQTASDFPPTSFPPISFLRNFFAPERTDMDKLVQHATAIGLLAWLSRRYEAYHRQNFRLYQPGATPSPGRPSSKKEFVEELTKQFAATWHVFDKATLHKALKVAAKLKAISVRSGTARGVILPLSGKLMVVERMPDKSIPPFIASCLDNERVRVAATNLSAQLDKIEKDLCTLTHFRWSPEGEDSDPLEQFLNGADLAAMGADLSESSH